MTITLRDADQRDRDAIVAVFLDCWQVSYAAVMPPALVRAMTSTDATELWLRAIADAAPGEIVVAESPAGIVGVARWSASGWVHSLYVSPTVQGSGVGALLLREVTRRIAGCGVTTAQLWVFRDNAPALAFYGGQGWQPDGTTRVEERFGEPEIRLARTLRPDAGALGDVAARLVDGTAAAVSGSPPAGVAVSLRSGRVNADAVAGWRTVATPTTSPAPLTLNTIHDLASVTKVATTSALLTLVSRHQLDLDHTVARYLPRFSDGAKATITVRDLLLHRGGMWEWQPLYVEAAGAGAADELVDRLPLRYQPRRERHYSDLGFIQLGRIVATVTGLTLDRAVAELVTQPLGLARTTFAHPAGDEVAMSSFGDAIERDMIERGVPYPVPQHAEDFARWRTEAVVGDVNDGNSFHAYGGVAGHAGLFSDVTDLVRIGAAMAAPECHEELWHPDVVAEFFAEGPDAGQALGLRRLSIELDGERTTMLGHTGFVGCAVGFVPGREVALAMASNRLVTTGAPVPTDDLWGVVVEAAAAALAEAP